MSPEGEFQVLAALAEMPYGVVALLVWAEWRLRPLIMAARAAQGYTHACLHMLANKVGAELPPPPTMPPAPVAPSPPSDAGKVGA